MSVLRQLNVLGQQRLDVPHIRSIESAVAADFDVLAGRVQGGGKPLVIRGFTLSNYSAGTNATSIQLNTADGIIYNMNASEAGTFLWVPADRTVETLNSSTNSRVQGSFTAGQTNYIGLDLVRTADDTTSDLVQFLDPNTLLEQPKSVPLARTLDYRILISTTPFSASSNVIPIAKVVTDAQNQVASATNSVQDARNVMWRLGSGGDFPNTYNSFSWAQTRLEYDPNVGALSGLDKFSGGDKGITSQKDWMDAVMTRLWEVGGGQNWYSPVADRNFKMTKAPGSVFTSTADNFEWVAGLYASTHLHWQGLKIVFENANVSGVYYNTVADQVSDDPAGSAALSKTALAIGDCIYVDIDRTSNANIIAKKAAIQTLGSPTIPGSRIILAWRDTSGFVFVRDTSFPVNTSFAPATTVAIGAVRLSYAAGTPATPTVIPLDANNSITVGTGSYLIGGTASAINATGGAGGGTTINSIGGGTAPTNYASRASGSAGQFIGGLNNAHGLIARSGSGTNIGTISWFPVNFGIVAVGSGTVSGTGGGGLLGISAALDNAYGIIGQGSEGFNTGGVAAIAEGSGTGIFGYSPSGQAGYFESSTTADVINIFAAGGGSPNAIKAVGGDIEIDATKQFQYATARTQYTYYPAEQLEIWGQQSSGTITKQIGGQVPYGHSQGTATPRYYFERGHLDNIGNFAQISSLAVIAQMPGRNILKATLPLKGIPTGATINKVRIYGSQVGHASNTVNINTAIVTRFLAGPSTSVTGPFAITNGSPNLNDWSDFTAEWTGIGFTLSQAALSELELEFDISNLGHTTMQTGTSSMGYGCAVAPLPNGDFLACGGWDNFPGTVTSTDARIFNPRTGMSKTIASMSLSRGHHAAWTIKSGAVIVVGGYTHSSTHRATPEVYFPSSNIWSSFPNITTSRWQCIAPNLTGDGVYVIGGLLTGGGYTTDVYELKVSSGGGTTSTAKAALPGQNAAAAASWVNIGGTTLLMVTGGLNEFSAGQSYVRTYNPNTNTWGTTTSMNQTHYGHAQLTLSDGRVFVVGSGPIGTAKGEIFDPADATWTTTSDYQTGVAGNNAPATRYNNAVLYETTDGVLFFNGENNVMHYRFSTDTWERIDMSFAVGRAPGVAAGSLTDGNAIGADGLIVCYGGFQTGHERKVFMYDPYPKLWSRATSGTGLKIYRVAIEWSYTNVNSEV